ncbi:MAG: leucyl aminopeptidase [Actinomycetota bacterium]|nr:leucyl aminopeptidase [Actinomycetota bacterium]
MIAISHLRAADELPAFDIAVVPVLKDRTTIVGDPLAPDLDAYERLLDAREFSGKVGQTLFVQTPDGVAPETLLVGLGDDVDAESLRRAAGGAVRSLHGYASVGTTLHLVDIEDSGGAVAMGMWLGSYSFDEYKSEPKPVALSSVFLVGGEDSAADVARAKVITDAIVLARDLVNRPALDKSPSMIADIAVGVAHNVSVKVYDETEIEEAGFGGLVGVNRGSDRPARMVVMRYEPEGASKTLALVGKGIVFDSGGLSIKPAAGMETMKTDMAGAAAVIGAVQAIAGLGFLVNVVGIAPLTENMTGGGAQRPGDVMTAYNGKTIEVLNTDAEGRLVLADGLALAAEMEPDLIIDIATLTGAAKVSLGPLIGCLFSNDDDAAATVEAASKAAGEKLWRMPLEKEYASMVESDIADMKNIGGRWGGAITAGLILSEFVGEIPWVHLDVAGPARADKTEHYVAKGGSGFGVRTLVAVAEAMAG